MNRRSLAPFAVVVACACRPTVHVETEVKGSTVVKGDPLGGLLSVFPAVANFTQMDITQTQEFKNQGVHKGDITSAKVVKFTLRIASPSDMDFSWLTSISFQAEAGSAKAPVASKSDVNRLGLAAPNPSFDLDLTGVELEPYVTADSMAITAQASARAPRSDTTLEAAVRVGADAVLVR